MTGRHDAFEAAHSVRPLDLVALVTFDGEIYENQAVSREHLVQPTAAPRPLGAAIEQWLGLGRQTWIDVRGRQIEGIATARELDPQAWIVETLLDASGGTNDDVLEALLRRAVEAAQDASVTHLLLRTPVGAPAVAAAMHVGFKPVIVQQVWRGVLAPVDGSTSALAVRPAEDADDFGRFQLFNRSLPIDARQALAITLEEWERTRERRWLGRNATELLAIDNGRIAAELRLNPGGDAPQFDLLADPDATDAATALLDAAASRLDSQPVLAVVPEAVPALGSLLAGRGLEPHAEYALLCHRTARPLTERLRKTAGATVATGG